MEKKQSIRDELHVGTISTGVGMLKQGHITQECIQPMSKLSTDFARVFSSL